MKKILLFFLIFFYSTLAFGTIKKNIIKNLVSTKNLSFNFEQNINGKVEKGECVIEYPKKIFCSYNFPNKKILVSNGKSLVIKTNNGSYYRYPIDRTPLSYILDKNYIIKEIKNLEERVIDNKFINFTLLKDNNEINIFFNKDNFTLVGWQTLDIYQNLVITYISTTEKNGILKKDIFKLPIIN